MTHDCPKNGCRVQVPVDMLACRSHWYQIPKAIRDAVWVTWAEGAGSGTPQHEAAIAAAIRSLNPDGCTDG